MNLQGYFIIYPLLVSPVLFKVWHIITLCTSEWGALFNSEHGNWKGGGVWMEAYIAVYVRDRQYQVNLFRWSNIYHRYCNKKVTEQIIWNIVLCFVSCVSNFCIKNERFLVRFKYSNNCTTIQVMSNVYVYENLYNK